MKNNILTLIIIYLSILSVNAQFNIEGKIRDSKTGETLANANIYFPDIKKGTVADIDGDYILRNIPSGTHKLKISYLSYSTKTIKIEGQNQTLKYDITLDPESSVCLHQVIVTAGIYSTQDETAIKIETLNKKDIEGLGGISLIKDLTRIPGIDAISKGNGISTPIIRGLSTSNILVLNNGVKMQNFQFSTNHPYMIDEFGVEKIEVVKGPASLLFGSNAVGGALNFIKESPASIGQTKSDLNFSYNSNTQGISSNVGVKTTPGKMFFGIRAGLKTHRDYIDGGNNIVPNSRFNEKSGKFFTGINNKNSTSKLYIDYNQMNLGLTIPPAIKLFENNDRKNKNWYQNLSNLLISSKNIFHFGKYKNEININYQTNNRKLFESPSNETRFKTVDMLLNTLTYELKTNKSFKQKNFIFSIQGLSQKNVNNDAPKHILPDFKLNDIAGMGLVQLNFRNNFHSQFGIRYDLRKIQIPEQETIKKEINKTYQNFSYSLGSTFNLSKHILLRTNIASGYRTPSIAELSQDGSHGSRYEIGNINLLPQRNYEGDLSMHYHSKKIKVELSGFYNKINNYIFLSPAGDKTEKGLPIYKFMQSDASLYGFESNLGYFPTESINLSTSYNYLVAKKENGEYLPLIPQNKLRTSISYFKNMNLKYLKQIAFNIESSYAFEKNNIHPSETITDSYNVYNVSISQQLSIKSQKIKLNFKINNVLDEKYLDHISTLKGLGYYEIGRNINIGIKINFNNY